MSFPRRLSPVFASLLAGVTVAAGTFVTIAAPAPAQARDSDSDVTFVTANIKTTLSDRQFRADAAEVLAHRPDFIAYNEVPGRDEEDLAPAGYQIYRDQTDQYTRATPVAWRTDRWSAVKTGTTTISSYDRRPKGKATKLGMRYANWAVLRSKSGRKVSIVSIHVAPTFKDRGRTVDLVRPSVQRLGELVASLPKGPVLVGGDFNVQHRGARYPQDVLSASAIVPTYDALGSSFPTGRQGNNATIDYVFSRGADTLRTAQHHADVVNSDHTLVVAGFEWQVAAPGARPRPKPVQPGPTQPGPTQPRAQRVVSKPSGSVAQRRAAVRAAFDSIRSMSRGGQVAVITKKLTLARGVEVLRKAAQRGVRVRFVTLSPRLTRREQKLATLARTSPSLSFARCRSACADRWRATNLAGTVVLTFNADGTPRERVALTRGLIRGAVEKPTKAVTSSNLRALRIAGNRIARLG